MQPPTPASHRWQDTRMDDDADPTTDPDRTSNEDLRSDLTPPAAASPDADSPPLTASTSDTAAGDTTPDDDTATRDASADGLSWTDLFPHPSAYAQQEDAIERAIDVLSDNGYLAMEGACGTGKTIISLVAQQYVVRTQDQFARTVVVTPVKQQLAQFVEELRAMNHSLTDTGLDPATGVVMVGRHDIHPYLREDALPAGTSLEDAREATADLVKEGSRISLDWPANYADTCLVPDCGATIPADQDRCPRHQSGDEDDRGDGPWYDPLRAEVVAGRAAAATDPDAAANTDGDVTPPPATSLVRETAATIRSDEDGPAARQQPLTTAGVATPFPADPPRIADVVANPAHVDEADRVFDPFYAAFLAAKARGEVAVLPASVPGNVVATDALVPPAAAAGVCPHETMSLLAASADVVIGNYNHVFDPETRRLTSGKLELLDEQTLLVIDEAHMLEERVRDLLSDTVSLQAIRMAHQDIAMAVETAAQSGVQSARTATELLEQAALRRADLKRAGELLTWLESYLTERVATYLDREHGDVQPRQYPSYPQEIPLREPSVPSPDALTKAAEDAGFGEEIWEQLELIGVIVEMIHEETAGREQCAAEAVGKFLQDWYEYDHREYFREVELSPTSRNTDRVPTPWEAAYTADLCLYNCMPTRELADVFDALGGGILMSATLEPLDIYVEVAGLQALADREASPRPVETATYGLQFPAANRESWVVTADRFTRRNRGDPTPFYDHMTETRQTYAHVIERIADSYGNVLLCFPSYREAEWAAELLDERGCDKPVLLDESSSRAATDDLLGEFVDPDAHRVLLTSTRGTLTEGVDYEGAKLHTAAVIGVPFVNIASDRVQAVMEAYGARFGKDFEYAVTVPAVRKTRQAIGRVLRGPGDVGVRLLVDERYDADTYRSVANHLSPDEQAEFETVAPDFVDHALTDFWETHTHPDDA